MKIATLFGVAIAVLLTENTSGELRCPDRYCVMCSLPHGMTVEQVYGTRCQANRNCTDANHLCCIRDTFGKFCTPGVDDTPKPGQCPAPAQLSLAERSRRCPADMGNRCSFDVDCPHDHKCCATSCGPKECAAPATGQTAASGRPSARPATTRFTFTYPRGGRGAATTTKAAFVVRPSKTTAVEGGGSPMRTVVERLRMKLSWLMERIRHWKERVARLKEELSASRSGASVAVAKSQPKSTANTYAASAAPVAAIAAAGAPQ